jgi:membrane glycosyltransferase
MRDKAASNRDAETASFIEASKERSKSSFLGEFWQLARQNKKWWLTPVVLNLMLVAVLVVLSATGAGPLVYTLF